MSAAELKERLAARALELGFARLGVAKAEPLGVEGERLRDFIQAGRHGEMSYLADTLEVRADPGHEGMLPGAKSVVVLATPYARSEPKAGPRPGLVARYAQGADYHSVLRRRVQKLASVLRAAGYRTRGGSDILPIFERAWAARAGLGFIGKNCCLIVPGLGSHVFLSALVTTAELPPDVPLKERCGSCTACLDACPTRAFLAPREMDARRCISYLTIEQRGAIDPTLRADLGEHVFGCDVCQDVCPFCRTAPLPEAQTARFAPDLRRQQATLVDLLSMDESQFEAYADGSALRRAGRVGMARNAAVVLGNLGEAGQLPALEAASRDHDSELVREAARWGAERVRLRVIR